jgi:hypothetical protein
MTQQLPQLLKLIKRFLPQRELELKSSRAERRSRPPGRRWSQHERSGGHDGRSEGLRCSRPTERRGIAAIDSVSRTAAAISGSAGSGSAGSGSAGSGSAGSGSAGSGSAGSGSAGSGSASCQLHCAETPHARGRPRSKTQSPTRGRQLPHPFWNVRLRRKLSHQHLQLTLSHPTSTIEQHHMVLFSKQRMQKLDRSEMQSTISETLQHQRQPLPSLSRQQPQVSLSLRHTERRHTVVIHRAIPTLEKQLPGLHLTEMHEQLHAQSPVSSNQPLQPRQQLIIGNATNFFQQACHVQPPAAVRRIYITRRIRSPAAPP